MDELRRAVGVADSCELLSAALAFPTRELAAALSDGAFLADSRSCLADAGVDSFVREAALVALSAFAGASSDELFGALRKGHSFVFLVPGGEPAVWPYESAFLFSLAGCPGDPPLFGSPCQIDVERHMREAGVLPKDARTEPADSVWNEFSFMSYLYGNVAKALHEGREDDVSEWSVRTVRFWDEHASKWLPAFMEKTVEEAPRRAHGVEYAALAEIGLLVLGAIREDVESRRTEA